MGKRVVIIKDGDKVVERVSLDGLESDPYSRYLDYLLKWTIAHKQRTEHFNESPMDFEGFKKMTGYLV